MPGGEFQPQPKDTAVTTLEDEETWLWSQIKAEARRDADSEPALASYLYSTILSHSSLERSLSFHLGNKLCSSTLLSTLLYDLFLNTFTSDPSLRAATVADLRAARTRDPACVSFSHCLLNYKGFLACQAHRVAQERSEMGMDSGSGVRAEKEVVETGETEPGRERLEVLQVPPPTGTFRRVPPSVQLRRLDLQNSKYRG